MIVGLAWLAMAAPPDDSAVWTTYVDEPYRTECTRSAGEPWCRAFGTSTASLERLGKIIEDRVSYTKTYSRVPIAEVLDAEREIFRLAIDLPSPLTDRDEVLQASRADDGAARVYRWTSITHPNRPPQAGYLRLPRAAGEWRLTPRADGGTDVRYSWQAEMLGSLPEWVLRRVWATTGPEIVRETITAAER